MDLRLPDRGVFGAVMAHPDYAAAMAASPRGASVFRILLVCLLLLPPIVVAILVPFLVAAPSGSLYGIAIVFVLLFLWILGYELRRLFVRRWGRLDHRVVQIVRRQATRGHSTAGQVTVAGEGFEETYPTLKTAFDAATRGSAGVAYVRGKELVGFRRLIEPTASRSLEPDPIPAPPFEWLGLDG